MTTTLARKSFTGVTIKDADQGLASAVFCTYDVVDRDGDVHVKGCFNEGASVVISAYGHKSWEGALPIGKGTIKSVGNEAICDMEFFMNTTHGRDTFETVKQLSEAGLQEWSYSLYEVTAERGVKDGKTVRFLKKINLVKEVSPTLMGAGIDTRTLQTKGLELKQLASMVSRLLGDAGRTRWERDYAYCYLDDFDLDAGTAVFCVVDWVDGSRSRIYLQVAFTRTDTSVTLGDDVIEVEYTAVYLPKSTKFSEHKDIALRGVTSLVEMAKERLPLRAAEGKSITEQVEAHDALAGLVAALKSAIDDATQPPPADVDTKANDQFANDLVRHLIAQGAPS